MSAVYPSTSTSLSDTVTFGNANPTSTIKRTNGLRVLRNKIILSSDNFENLKGEKN
jgi:hypothetical protein